MAISQTSSEPMFINGEWTEGTSGKRIPVFDPSTEEVIAAIPDASSADINAAVAAARYAFDEGGWPQTSAQERGRILFRIAAKLREEAPQLAELESRNCGKPIVEAEYDIADAATCFEYYGGLANKVSGLVNPVPDNALSLSLKEPVGVAGQIIPWNYPIGMAAWKLAGWLAECGVPAGVVNVVTGLGETAGAAIVAHPHVDKVAFTGSAAVGKLIMKSAADTLKRVTLELGGKSPNIFFADADFEAAIDGALFGIFINQGEVCSAGSRVLVQRSIYQKFLEAMTEKARTIKLGPPLDRSTKMGPLVSREQYDRVSAYQTLGKSEAKLALGGGRPASISRGYYVEPTIFYDVDNSARIAREEIFGPVAAVIPFEDEREALRIANDTPFGLAAAVWSRDIYRAMRMVKAIRAGVVWVNHMQPTCVEAPWGGFKQSGFGRELGIHGIDEYLETKQVYINLNEAPIGWY